MSTPFHVFKGSALAIGSSAMVGIALGSKSFLVWMILLILATNMADKDVLWCKFIFPWWGRRDLKVGSREFEVRAWCFRWGKHRLITHSIVGLNFDLTLLVSLTMAFQEIGWLPVFNPFNFILLGLLSHLVADIIDGSEGIAIFAPFSDYMFKLPGLFQDLDFSHMTSPDPAIRREFFYKVKWETALTSAMIVLALFAVPGRL